MLLKYNSVPTQKSYKYRLNINKTNKIHLINLWTEWFYGIPPGEKQKKKKSSWTVFLIFCRFNGMLLKWNKKKVCDIIIDANLIKSSNKFVIKIHINVYYL